MATLRNTSPRRQAAIAEIERLIREHSLTRDELVACEPKGVSPWERQRRIAFDHCRQMVDFWQISAVELRNAKYVPSPVYLPTVKYRHPVSGETWDGQGPQPDWLKRALLKEGYTVREIKTDPDADDSALKANGKHASPSSMN